MSAPGTSIPAGWYPDPANPGHGRYWNGIAWTDLFHVPGQPFPAGAQPKAAPGTDGNTVWIWLIVFPPVLPLVLLLFLPWGSMFAIDPTAADPYSGLSGMLGFYLSPLLWISTILSYAIYGFSVYFAYRDVRELTARGVPKPFHWAFAFIGGAVYAIGRSVIVARRTGRGYAPVWVEAGVLLVSFVVVGVIYALMFSSMADLISTIPTYR
jgi:hypothetical protein